MQNACCALYYTGLAAATVMVHETIACSPVNKDCFSESKCIRRKCLLLALHFTFQLNHFDTISFNSKALFIFFFVCGKL